MLVTLNVKVKHISLIYFDNCPNYKPVRKILLEVGLPFKEIRQDDLHKGCVCGTFSSPTILIDNDIIILGGEIDSLGSACSINMPDKKELKILLELFT